MQFWNLIAISSIEHIMEGAYSYFPGDKFIAFISYISAVIIHRLMLLLACSFCVFISQYFLTYFDHLLYTQFMPTSTWAKKSSSKSTCTGSKVHIVATWETIKKLKNSTPFEGLLVLRLNYLPIWAEHANCYLLKECYFLIFL